MADRPISEVLKESLSINSVRVIDLFREWDENGDGNVSKKEFRKAILMLGIDPEPSKADIDALFDEWDPDGSGSRVRHRATPARFGPQHQVCTQSLSQFDEKKPISPCFPSTREMFGFAPRNAGAFGPAGGPIGP